MGGGDSYTFQRLNSDLKKKTSLVNSLFPLQAPAVLPAITFCHQTNLAAFIGK